MTGTTGTTEAIVIARLGVTRIAITALIAAVRAGMIGLTERTGTITIPRPEAVNTTPLTTAAVAARTSLTVRNPSPVGF